MPAVAYLLTPLGTLALGGSEAGLHTVQFLDGPAAPPATPAAATPACLAEAHRQLRAYFGRELTAFDLLCQPLRGTAFQRQVWALLPAVAHGNTASYLALARQLGNPGAVRAVGAANGQNPLALVWPCHRVVGANGSLTGYAGGLERKRWLLHFEQPMPKGGLF